MPFARFMELALYCPVYGYYEKEADRIGRRGDFYTSVSVGELYGQLLAYQFARWMESLPGQGQGRLQLVESGAHRGGLARDILGFLRGHRPDIYAQTEYWLIEPSVRRREWQSASLSHFAGKVQWASSLVELGTHLSSGIRGVIFSNELLDAFPVHRLAWDAKHRSWFEWGVGVEGGRLVWVRLSPRSTVHDPQSTVYGPESTVFGPWSLVIGLEGEVGQLSEVLPDGFIVESCPAAKLWWKEAAELLSAGKLMTIDYGLTFEERFRPERAGGTLRAYRGHGVHSKLLEEPGEQDITAHVDFTALEDAGEACGLTTDFLGSQMEFLTPLAIQMWEGETGLAPAGPEARRQFQTLVHPEHLGRAFRVLVQSRRG